MPELPEVEAARALLEAELLGRTIESVTATESGGGPRTGLHDDVVFSEDKKYAGRYTYSAQTVRSALSGKKLVAVRRRGKQLWLELSSPPHLLAHFGMTGSFVVRGVAPLAYQEFKVHDEQWPPRFTKLELGFSGDARLAFCDPRRIGRLRLRDSPEEEEPWRSLAPDALTHPIGVNRALEACASCAGPIKSLLLDQEQLVSGVGNWVADEVLFQARLHPAASAASLSDHQVREMHRALNAVVREAVRCSADSKRFPTGWLFHYRWSKGRANGAAVPGVGRIDFVQVGGRTSAVVSSVQRKGERDRQQRNTPADPKKHTNKAGKAKAVKQKLKAKPEAKRGRSPAEPDCLEARRSVRLRRASA